ncbi:hypothetical protein [Nocardioides sp.]|uniref:hypothetical protein n=1 Tax=Nocardioides sp. TaxID=35761 RepID=UPI0025F10AA7|nr:hypothetical protein [Nocardioides sp.]
MSSTRVALPDLARAEVTQRLRDADDERRRRLARRTGGRTTRPAATRSAGWRRAELAPGAISG